MESSIEKLIEETNSFLAQGQRLLDSLHNGESKNAGVNRRRLKPTLIASFGLLTVNEKGDEHRHYHHHHHHHNNNNNQQQHPNRPATGKISPIPKTTTDSLVGEGWKKIFKKSLHDNQSNKILPYFDERFTKIFLQFWRMIYKLCIAFRESPDESLVQPLECLIPRFEVPLLDLINLAPSLTKVPFFHSLIPTEMLTKMQDQSKTETGFEVEVDSGSSLALPYDDRRDSRGKNRLVVGTRASKTEGERESGIHQLHTNQQKARDLLHAWLRDPSSRTYTIHNILETVKGENYGWFASLLLEEFHQIEARHHRHSSSTSKLALLEDRLQGKDGGRGTNAILTFITGADSLALSSELREQVFTMIETESQSLLDGFHRTEPSFSARILRIAALGQVLALLTRKTLGRYDDEVVCFMEELLITAYREHHLLLILPLLYTWLLNCTLVVQKSMAPFLQSIRAVLNHPHPHPHHHSHHQNHNHDSIIPWRNRVAIVSWLLSGVINTDAMDADVVFQLPSPAPLSELTPNIDMVENLPLERILAATCLRFRNLVIACSTIHSSIDTTILSIDGDDRNSTIHNSNPSPSTTPRKIRPLLNQGPEQGDHDIQRRLRHWFWWQHQPFRDYTHALLNYLQGPLGRTADEATARLLLQILPKELLPESLRDEPIAVKRIAALLLEQLPTKFPTSSK